MKTLIFTLLVVAGFTACSQSQCVPTQSLALNDVDTVQPVAAVTICLPQTCAYTYSALVDLPNRPMLVRLWSTSPMPVRATVLKNCHLVALDSCGTILETASAGVGFFLWIDNSLGDWDLSLQWSAPSPVFIHATDHSQAVLPVAYLDTDTLCNSSNLVGNDQPVEEKKVYIDIKTGQQVDTPKKDTLYWDGTRKVTYK